ncbi:MAG: HD domain-containing protein [Candidatus Marinimicrobia bacterium]|nr:HD domain-containing protein [Candidatus Neomarinimicrobiota bacterium]
MVRMRDILKSYDDLQKESNTEARPVQPKPQQTHDTESQFSGIGGLDAIRKAIQKNLQTGESGQIFATRSKSEPVATANPSIPPDVTPSQPPLPPKQEPAFVVPPTPVQTVQTITEPAMHKESTEDAATTKLYMDLHRIMEKVVADIKNDQPISVEPLKEIIPELITSVSNSESLFLRAIQRKRYATWVISHSVNVAVFALKIGCGLKYPRDKQAQLALAALLHDVGMVKVPNRILFKHGKLTDAEFDHIKEHPVHGFEIVKHLNDDYPYIVSAVYQEQEREDGTGYPQGLKSNEISEYAKILGVADVFEALVHGRTYRDGFITYNAIQKIIESKAKQFSPKIIRALVNGVSMYPVGSLVKLSTDEIARVVSVNTLRPVRPVVEVLEDNEGRKLKTPLRINLETEPLIYITKPITE